MTSRERVLAALRHEEADRCPIDFGGMRHATGIDALAYAQLRRHLGIDKGRFKMGDCAAHLAMPEPEVLDRLHVDTVQLVGLIKGTEPHGKGWKDWTY